MRPRIPPPMLMILAALLMWALDHWMPLAQWIIAPWNRLGGMVAAVGIAIDLAALVRFRKARTTVNPLDPSKASAPCDGRGFSHQPKSDVFGAAATADRVGGLAR